MKTDTGDVRRRSRGLARCVDGRGGGRGVARPGPERETGDDEGDIGLLHRAPRRQGTPTSAVMRTRVGRRIGLVPRVPAPVPSRSPALVVEQTPVHSTRVYVVPVHFCTVGPPALPLRPGVEPGTRGTSYPRDGNNPERPVTSAGLSSPERPIQHRVYLGNVGIPS